MIPPPKTKQKKKKTTTNWLAYGFKNKKIKIKIEMKDFNIQECNSIENYKNAFWCLKKYIFIPKLRSLLQYPNAVLYVFKIKRQEMRRLMGNQMICRRIAIELGSQVKGEV